MAATSLAAETFKRVYPSEFHARFTEAGVRPDGRDMMAARPTTVHLSTISTADGSALVTIGRTTVVCGVKAEFANPPLEHEDQGWLIVNATLPPMCSPEIRPGLPSLEAQSLTHFLHELFHRANVLDLHDLSIIPKKLSWVLHVDIVCLNYDGNVVDAAVLATCAALENTSLPRVCLPAEGEEMEAIPPVDLTDRQPLRLHRRLFASTFVLMAPSTIMLDATAEEEDLAANSVTVVTDGSGTVFSTDAPAPHMKPTTINDSQGWPSSSLISCVAPACSRASELQALIKTAATRR